MLQMLSRLFFFLLGTYMEQFLLVHWIFDFFDFFFYFFFYKGHLGGLQKRVLSSKPSSSFLLSDVIALLTILTFTTSFPEKTIWILPLLLNFLFCQHYKVWYRQRNWLLRLNPKNKISHTKKMLKISGPRIEFWGIP